MKKNKENENHENGVADNSDNSVKQKGITAKQGSESENNKAEDQLQSANSAGWPTPDGGGIDDPDQ